MANEPKAHVSALSDLMEGAKALQAVQAQAAQDALRLPNPRLDHPQGPTTFLRPNGDGTFQRVDPNGNVLEDSVKE